MTMEDVNARAMAMQLGQIKQVDFLLDRAERSRNVLIQSIEGRRAALAESLRHATKELEGEAQEVQPDVPAFQGAAE